MEVITLVTDGATGDSNPGMITLGGMLVDESGYVVHSFTHSTDDHGTNNVAEYRAIIHGLEKAIALGYKNVRCLVDSQLIAKQIMGTCQCKDPHLVHLRRHAVSLRSCSFDSAPVRWHRRDTVLAMAADRCSKGFKVPVGYVYTESELHETS